MKACGQAHGDQPQKAFLASALACKLMKKAGGARSSTFPPSQRAAPPEAWGFTALPRLRWRCLTRVLAVELASDHINVNAVAPSVVKTQFSQPFWSNEALLQEITRTIPMGRIAETGDVVGAVLFLASKPLDFITGEVVTVDGGPWRRKPGGPLTQREAFGGPTTSVGRNDVASSAAL